MFTFQMLLLATSGSDKNKTKEEMKMDNDNGTETVVIFVPRVNHSLGDSGSDTEVVGDVVDTVTLPGQLQAGVANECLCNEGLESFLQESPHAYHRNSDTVNLPRESTNLDACEPATQTTADHRDLTNDDVSEDDLLQIAESITNVITDTQTVDSIAHQNPQTNLHESSTNISKI